MDDLAALQNAIATIKAGLADGSIGQDERDAIHEGALHLAKLTECKPC